MNEPLSLFTRRRNTTRLIFLVIILVTLPCYCLGTVLLATAPKESRTRSQSETSETLAARTATALPTASPTITPFRTATSSSPLGPTPPQIWLPTNTPFFFPTWTPFPTMTIALTLAPTLTPVPTVTPIPTATLVPTATLAPTDVPVPTTAPVPTTEPVPTTAPESTLEPPPTQETM